MLLQPETVGPQLVAVALTIMAYHVACLVENSGSATFRFVPSCLTSYHDAVMDGMGGRG